MSDQFDYGVFISHSSNDKPVVRELANRLKQDGLRVWLDEWEIQPGDMIGLKISQGLERSRIPPLRRDLWSCRPPSSPRNGQRSSIIRCCFAIRPIPNADSFRCSLKIANCLM